MFLSNLKKLVLLLFLFVFIGNVLFAPISAKADNASPPTPSNSCVGQTMPGSELDSEAIHTRQLCMGTKIKPIPTPSVQDKKANITIEWEVPKVGQQVIIQIANFGAGGGQVTKQYNFEKYELYRTGPNGNETITLNEFGANSYVDKPNLVSGQKNSFQYSMKTFYKKDPGWPPLIGAHDPYAENSINSVTTEFNSDGQPLENALSKDKYGPFLGNPKPTYENNTGKVSLDWRRPEAGAPNGSPKYTIYRWQVQSDQTNTPQKISESDSSDQVISKVDEKVVSNLAPNSTYTVAYSVKANWREGSWLGFDVSWGYSNTATITFKADANGKVTATFDGFDQSITDDAVNKPSALNQSGCGCSSIAGGNPLTKWFNESICLALCSISEAMGKFIAWTMDFLLSSVKEGGAYHPSPNKSLVIGEPRDYILSFLGVEKTYAKLSDDFSPTPPANKQWITTIWKFSLGIVNTIVVALLIFLAFVNILRIQVDTYALKKILPTLLIAVVLANFSLLICRMIVDLSEVLSRTFIGMDSGASFGNSVTIMSKKLAAAVGVGLLSGPSGLIGAVAKVPWLGGLLSTGLSFPLMIVSFLLGLIIFGAVGALVLALAFLLYIRIPLVSILVAISPLAFMAMVLPSTQPLFKKWWGLFANWVFMLPVVLFLLRIVTLLNPSVTQLDLPAYFLAIGILAISIMVPFKMGGTVMNMWGNIGKKAGLKTLGWGGRLADRGAVKAKDALADSKLLRNTGFGRWLKNAPGVRGAVGGWLEGSKKEDEEYMNIQTGQGRTLRESVHGGLRLQKRGIIVNEGENRQKEAYQTTGTALAGSIQGSPDNLRSILNSQGINGDYQKARDAYLGLAAHGEATQADQKAFFDLAEKKGQSADALIVGTAAEALAAKSGKPEGYLVSPKTRDEKGNIIDRDQDEIAMEHLKRYRRLPGTADEQTAHLKSLLNFIIDPADGKTVLDREKFTDAKQHAVAQLLGELGEKNKLVVDAGDIAITAAQKYKLDKIDFSEANIDGSMAGLSGEEKQKLKENLQGNVELGSLSIPVNFDAKFVAKAKHISDNFDTIKKVMAEHRKNLMKTLANDPSLNNQLHFHDKNMEKMQGIDNFMRNKNKRSVEWLKQLNNLQKNK